MRRPASLCLGIAGASALQCPACPQVGLSLDIRSHKDAIIPRQQEVTLESMVSKIPKGFGCCSLFEQRTVICLPVSAPCTCLVSSESQEGIGSPESEVHIPVSCHTGVLEEHMATLRRFCKLTALDPSSNAAAMCHFVHGCGVA